MTVTEQIQPILKNLRLSGILETLDLRSRQALEEKLPPMEFLHRVLLDENERRGQKQLVLRMKRAALDPNKTLETFEFGANKSLNRIAVNLSSCISRKFAFRSRICLDCSMGRFSSSRGRRLSASSFPLS